MTAVALSLAVYASVMLNGTSGGQAQHGHPASGRPLRLELPITERSLCSAALQWSTSTGTPIGAECLWDVGRETGDTGRIKRVLDLTGLDARESLRLLSDQLSGYSVTVKQGVAVFRQAPIGTAISPLDKVVGQFTLRNASLEEAVNAIYNIVNPSGRGARQRDGRSPTRGVPDQAGARVSVDVSRASVETILTTICAAYGNNLSWRVGYLSAERSPDKLIIQLLNSSASATAGPNLVSAR